MLPLKLKSWKRHITKTGLETENDEQLQKRESEIEPLQSAQTIIHQNVLTAVSSLTILVALLSFCFIVCRASFCCACSSLIRSNASCSYFVQRNGKGSGINFYDKVSRKFLAIKGILALRTREEITGGFPIKLTELQCERQTFFFFFWTPNFTSDFFHFSSYPSREPLKRRRRSPIHNLWKYFHIFGKSAKGKQQKFNSCHRDLVLLRPNTHSLSNLQSVYQNYKPL